MSNSKSKFRKTWNSLTPEKQRMAWLTIWPLLCEFKVMPPPVPLSELVKRGMLSSDEQALIASVWAKHGITAE